MRRLQKVCFGIGLVGVAASIACVLLNSREFFAAWLFAWFYWFSIAVGCLGFFMIYRLTGGAWGEGIERILISAGTTFEALGILFLPLFGGFHALYPWARPELVALDPKRQQQHAYLNIPFWCIRAVFYFAVWIALSRMLTRARREGARQLSAVGLILVFLTVSFAAVDWIMSLEPLWYSTIYGLIVLCAQGLIGYGFALLVLQFVHRSVPEWAPPLTPKALKDHGSILLTASIVWTYTSFVQWLIIWIGNVPDTVTWYTVRSTPAWARLAWVIFIGQFLIPFQLLLWQRFKERTRNLAALGAFLLLVHLANVYWLIVPPLSSISPGFNVMTLATWPAVGGLWLAYFLWLLQGLELTEPGSEHTFLLKELIHG